MGNSKKKYEKTRDHILNNSEISDSKKSSLLFNNWQNYIFESLPEKPKVKHIEKLDKEMVFVRL